MTILQQPDILSLSSNIKVFRVATTETISFVLKQGSEEIITQSYDPGKDGIVIINVRDIVHSRLSFTLQESALVYEQSSLAATFTAVISGTEVTFRVIRSGVDRLADTATNFLTQNFLTWQPSVKAVTYYSPEFLTYYAVVACAAKLRAYFTDDSGVATTQQDITLANFDTGKAYTIPLQYASVAEKLGNKLPAYYDVWIESPTSARLTYIQRYYASDMLSEQEQWILFENSLGGIDTFRAYGSTDFTGDHTHNIAEIDEVSTEYRVDITRKFQKNTGHLKAKERQWLLDFFPSQAKYIYAGTYLRSIVVIESNVTYTDRELPSNYTFTYKYADARPLLNLPRTDIPSEALHITVPSVGSFTVPPRLVEFPRLPLTEGALFPVQNPYSEKWGTATAGSISDFIAQRLSENYNGEGGVGHNHKNIDLLNLLSYIDEYLLVAGKKIKSGKSDESDITRLLRTTNFIPGIIGAIIDQFGDGEMGSLVLRKFLSIPELRFNRAIVYKGKQIISPGGGCLIESFTLNGNGTWTIVPKLEEGEPLSQEVDDILLAYWHDKDVTTGAFKGFREMKFRVVSADYDAKTFVIAPKPDSLSVPSIAMTLAQVGNFTNKERQTYTMIDSTLGNNNITFFDDCNTWDIEENQEKSWFGKKKGRTVAGIDTSVYSAVLKHVIMTGLIFQIDEISGDLVRVPCDKGAHIPEKRYAYYDRVSSAGALWLCVNEKGTSNTPADGSEDWLKQVSEGSKGDAGESIRMLGHWNSSMRPVPANCMVSYAKGVYLSLRETNQAPVSTLMCANGSYFLNETGGYTLASNETNEDWELILENGKNGVSILFQGSFPAAPANPKDGWSYYNTSDKRSYVYQGGKWYLTSVDGKDGKGFEWIFTRTKTNEKPIALTSEQKDDYVPAGWTDDPVGCTAEYVYEWTCKRTKKDGVWGDYSAASIFNMYSFSTKPQWSTNNADWHDAFAPGDIYIRYSSDGGKTWTDGARAVGETGKDGPYTDFEFAVGVSDIQAPANGWLDAPAAVSEGQYLWMRAQYIVPPATVNPDAWKYSRLTGITGSTGAVGIIPCGHWQSANTPYKKTSLVTMHNATFVALVDTAKPPVWLLKWGPGPTDYLINHTGRYTPLTSVENNRNTEWLMITPPPVNGTDGNDGNDSTSYWLTSPVSTININSVGSLSPSSVLISCKKKKGEGAVTDCSDFFLAARKYNGSWLAHVSPVKASSIGVPSVAGYTQFAVRAYNSAAEAEAWGSGFVSEIGVGVSKDGATGDTGPAGSFPRDRGVFVAGTSYVWSPSYRDKVLFPFDGVYYNFLVANYGATVTAAPTSASGDGLWEAMGKYKTFVADVIFAEGANVANFMFKNEVLRSQTETNGVPNIILNGKTGYVHFGNADITGVVNATSGSFKGQVNALSGKIGGFTIERGSLWWKGYDYFGGDSRSVRIGVPTDETSGMVDINFNAATEGRFGVKAVGATPGGACIYASSKSSGFVYPDYSNTYAGFFDGRVFFNEQISSRLCLADGYGAIVSRLADGRIEYSEGIDYNFGTMLFRKGILVRSN